MKKIFILCLLIPLLGVSQTDSTFNSKGKVIKITESGINDLVRKYKNLLKNKGGSDGWRIQIKFASKRKDILTYKMKFTNLFPTIPTQIKFESPYYKLTVGNFKTKNLALKTKEKISVHFPAAHPVPSIINLENF